MHEISSTGIFYLTFLEMRGVICFFIKFLIYENIVNTIGCLLAITDIFLSYSTLSKIVVIESLVLYVSQAIALRIIAQKTVLRK